MGFSFHPAGCVKRAEDESHSINIKGSPPRAAKTKKNPPA